MPNGMEGLLSKISLRNSLGILSELLLWWFSLSTLIIAAQMYVVSLNVCYVPIPILYPHSIKYGLFSQAIDPV